MLLLAEELLSSGWRNAGDPPFLWLLAEPAKDDNHSKGGSTVGRHAPAGHVSILTKRQVNLKTARTAPFKFVDLKKMVIEIGSRRGTPRFFDIQMVMGPHTSTWMQSGPLSW